MCRKGAAPVDWVCFTGLKAVIRQWGLASAFSLHSSKANSGASVHIDFHIKDLNLTIMWSCWLCIGHHWFASFYFKEKSNNHKISFLIF